MEARCGKPNVTLLAGKLLRARTRACDCVCVCVCALRKCVLRWKCAFVCVLPLLLLLFLFSLFSQIPKINSNRIYTSSLFSIECGFSCGSWAGFCFYSVIYSSRQCLNFFEDTPFFQKYDYPLCHILCMNRWYLYVSWILNNVIYIHSEHTLKIDSSFIHTLTQFGSLSLSFIKSLFLFFLILFPFF